MPNDPLAWVKKAILPAARAGFSRHLGAGSLITAACAGFQLVKPLDTPSILFRWACLIVGIYGLVWLVIVAHNPQKPEAPKTPREKLH
jgi:hypothetical protein